MNAQQILGTLDLINKYGFQIEAELISENLKLIDEIYALAESVVPCDAYRNGNDRMFWLSAERGSFEDFAETYRPSYTNADHEIDTERMKEDWPILFPDEKEWFKLYLASHEGNRGVWLGNRCIYSTIKKDYYAKWLDETVDAGPLLQWVIQEVKNRLEMIKAGTYYDYICENLPYRHRSGVVNMKTYWKYVPEDKERIFKGIDEKEWEEYHNWKQDETPGLDSMTVKDYLKACDSLYDLLGVKEKYPISESDNPPRTEYRFYAANYNSARAFLSLDEESPEAFDEYITSGYVDNHVWEVCLVPRVHLFPSKINDKYYLYFRSDHNEEYSFVIHLTLEMKRLGYPMIKPVYIEEKSSGEELIKITPYGDSFDFRYAYDRDYRLTDSRRLPRGYCKELIEEIEWFPIKNKWKMR